MRMRRLLFTGLIVLLAGVVGTAVTQDVRQQSGAQVVQPDDIYGKKMCGWPPPEMKIEKR
ncbi:MAG: hypothetical protein AABY89_07720 [Acidobacteriota bacterium]